jgi:hypothetical protein
VKERWERLQQESREPLLKINGEPWPLYIDGTKISHNFLAAINDHASGLKARNSWNDHKQRFGEGSIDDVELTATEDAINSVPMARQPWLTKHTAGFNAKEERMDSLQMLQMQMRSHSRRFRARNQIPRSRSMNNMRTNQ